MHSPWSLTRPKTFNVTTFWRKWVLVYALIADWLLTKTKAAAAHWLVWSRLAKYELFWNARHSRTNPPSRTHPLYKFSTGSENQPKSTGFDGLTPTRRTVPDKALFGGYWSQLAVRTDYNYAAHKEFLLAFMSPSYDKRLYGILSASSYFKKWFEGHNFLLNIFSADPVMQMFSGKTFIEETLTFNWHLAKKNATLFKLVNSPLNFIDTRYSGLNVYRTERLRMLGTDLIFLMDFKAQEKTMFFLRKESFYLVGLVPINYSPWLVSYAFPSFSDSDLAQLFFFSYLNQVRASALRAKQSSLLGFWSCTKAPRSS